MKKYIKGFTLIELLVVIAIIGILASVVLVSLNSARSKGKDTRIISTVQQLRTQFESDGNGSDYGNAFNLSGATIGIGGPSSVVTTAGVLLADAMSNAPAGYTGSTTIAAAGSAGTNEIVVVSNGVAASGAWTTKPTWYAIYGRVSTGAYFCIDSTGKTNPTSASANTQLCP